MQFYSMELVLQRKKREESADTNPLKRRASKETRGFYSLAVQSEEASLEFKVVEELEGCEGRGQGHAGCVIYKADAVLQRGRGAEGRIRKRPAPPNPHLIPRVHCGISYSVLEGSKFASGIYQRDL
jgi:hypothetical protein